MDIWHTITVSSGCIHWLWQEWRGALGKKKIGREDVMMKEELGLVVSFLKVPGKTRFKQVVISF